MYRIRFRCTHNGVDIGPEDFTASSTVRDMKMYALAHLKQPQSANKINSSTSNSSSNSDPSSPTNSASSSSGHSVDDLRLIWNGKYLEDSRSVQALGIPKGEDPEGEIYLTTIHLHIRPRQNSSKAPVKLRSKDAGPRCVCAIQ